MTHIIGLFTLGWLAGYDPFTNTDWPGDRRKRARLVLQAVILAATVALNPDRAVPSMLIGGITMVLIWRDNEP